MIDFPALFFKRNQHKSHLLVKISTINKTETLSVISNTVEHYQIELQEGLELLSQEIYAIKTL